MSLDLPDYTRMIAINVNIPPAEQMPVITRPKGGILEKGVITTTVAYQTVASHIVTDEKYFQLSKVVISTSKAAWIKYRWNGADISVERNPDDKTIIIEHFPWDYCTMLGNGVKAFDVQAKYDTEAGLVNVEIVGEEVA